MTNSPSGAAHTPTAYDGCACDSCAPTHDLNRDTVARMVRDVLPDYELWHTGGGCMALAATIGPRGRYVMLTTASGVDAPRDPAAHVLVGVYEEGDNEGTVVEATNLADALALVRHLIAD